ncbi:MAG: hypothetical protein JWM90_2723 [Thermoleophilia bacterium]|nr:hypothetical protein [Thermoleophilia bacterium]
MSAVTALTTPSEISRAAALARGPHACPMCEAPTWTEPPVPWTGLRDYVARCTSCERPIQVRIDQDRVVRQADRRRPPRRVDDRIDRFLDDRGTGAFPRRLAASTVLLVLYLGVVAQLGVSGGFFVLAALPGIVGAALFGPVLVASSLHLVLGSALALQRRPLDRPVEVDPARWDQWVREERRRSLERAEQPEAVFAELERVLDPRELRRVRALAVRGEVPVENLDDLLTFRRSWTSVA